MVLQAFIIVGGITRLIPLTGITLPFISQGGSSLLASFIIVGFLLRCGDEGTGVGEEMASATTSLHANSVLGRVSLGKRLTHAMIILSTLFALLVANLTLIMVVQASYYQNMPGNNHTMAKESRTERGTISTYDGVILAQSVQQEDGTYERVYPAGNLATHVVGYASTQFGTSGIEAAENDTLKGQQNYASWTDVLNSLAGVGGVGNDVTLTLNSKIQQAAQDALSGDSAGACVVHRPRDGRRARHGVRRPPTTRPTSQRRARARPTPTPVASARCSTARYAERSTPPAPRFKSRSRSPRRFVRRRGHRGHRVQRRQATMDIGGAPVTNYGKTLDYGDITLARATEVSSSNAVFGQLGVETGRREARGRRRRVTASTTASHSTCTLNAATSLMADPAEMSEVGDRPGRPTVEPVHPRQTPRRRAHAGPQATALQMALVRKRRRQRRRHP